MSNTEGELADHVQRLSSELDADEEDIRNTLENLLEYSVPLDEAERTVRRRYESTDPEPGGLETKVGELGPGDSNVAVEVKVLSAGKRSIQSNGEETTIVEGMVADESGAISYTAWDELPIEVGESVRFEGVGVREWNGETQLNIGGNAEVIHIDDVETEFEAGGTRDLSELEEGDRAVSLEVGVVEAEERKIRGRDGETKITSGVLGDSSGRLPFTDWENRDLDVGASYHVDNAYVNEFRGVPQVNMGKHTDLSRSGDVDVSHTPPELTIAEAVEKGGVFDVVVEGDVLVVKDGSGLIQRCPECGRVIQKGQCRSHGDVDGETDLRTKAVLDDGSGALNLILDRELTEKVYDGSLEEAEGRAREAMDQGVVGESIAEALVGRRWRVRGNVSVGEYGANLEAKKIERVDGDVSGVARGVLDEFS